MNLFESERKVMDVLWREGSITAGEIAKIRFFFQGAVHSHLLSEILNTSPLI